VILYTKITQTTQYTSTLKHIKTSTLKNCYF